MKIAKIVRDLADLDKLEARIRKTVNPSAVLLAEINKRREALLNGKDPDATNAPIPGK